MSIKNMGIVHNFEVMPHKFNVDIYFTQHSGKLTDGLTIPWL
jgi:hypothetical protein